ncbi:Kynurenine formamidase [Zea mays]|uniref:Kynurenine formamidase n=1 Tax=Zea mays TaxID=4577 RepID=A0A3L6F630_MAIZE|nr:Kynurenine formamidase [Zea mays]
MGGALLLALVLAAVPLSLGGGGGGAHPGYSDADESACTVDAGAELLRRMEERGPDRRIIDITHAVVPDLPAFATGAVAGPMLRLRESMADGSEYNLSELRMECHTGTHVDAPGHINQAHFAAGLDVDTLDLHVLNGPALLVDVPRDTNITAEAMEFLNIPRGVRRVLFRTLNTDRKLMWRKGGDMSYVGFTEDGAQWLVDNTDIKLVGVDGLSVASFDHLISAHVVFFKTPDIIPVESLNLDDIEAGIYMLHCLPLRLVGAEGAPTRCILIK